MNKLMQKLPPKVTLKLGKVALFNKKHAPETLFGTGVVGVVATVVLTGRQTILAHEAIKEAKNDLKEIEAAVELEKEEGKGRYTEEDRKKDVTYVYVRTTLEVTKLYLPVVALGAFSIAALTKSHFILHQRNAGLAAAYAVLDKSFSEYRNRVRKDLGRDADDHYRYGGEIVDVKEEKKDGEIVATKKFRVNANTPSGYARFFDELCPNWQKQPEYNLIFLRCQQNYANDILRSRGYIFLNDVYDMLGIERSSSGSVVGWAIGKEGDNYVDFGLFDGNNERIRDFVNGREGAVLLDFNVDGVIYDKVDRLNRDRRR